MEGELEILLGELHIKMKGPHTHTTTHSPGIVKVLSVTSYKYFTRFDSQV